MAFITLSGTLLDPNGDLAVGDQIRFTHKSTTGETVQSAVSIITVNPAGTYSLPLQYGLVLVEYKDVRTQQFKNLGVATVNGTNPATSIPELLNALVPVSSAELIEFQAILADCVTAQTAAENAATTAEAFAYQLTTTDLVASTATFSAATNIPTSGFTTSGDSGNGSWKQNGLTGILSQSPAQLGNALLNDGNGNQWAFVGKALFTEQLGGVLNGVANNSLVITACKKWSTDTGGNVYLGMGTMKSGQILVTTGETFRLIGLNRELSIHKIIAGTNSNNIQLTGDGTAKAYLKNLTLDGDMDNQTGGGHGIRSAGCLQLELDNVLITNSLNYGIGLQAGTSKGMKWTNLEIRRCGSDGIDVKDYNLDNELIYINGFLCSGHGETNTDSPALDVRGEVNASNITVNITGANVGVRYRNVNAQGRSGFGVMSNVNVNGDGVSACVAAKFETSSKMASISGLTVNNAAIAVIQSATGVGGIVTGLQGNNMYTNDAIEISGSDMSITGSIETTGRVIDINSTGKRASIDINANRDSATAETIRLQAGATDCTIKGFIVDGTLNDSGTGTDTTNLRLVSA